MQRADHPEHDVLIFPRKDQLDTTAQFIRVPAAEAAATEVAANSPSESNDARGRAATNKAVKAQPKNPPQRRPPYGAGSEEWDLLDYGARRAVSAARPELAQIEPNPAEARAESGPGFAVLPVKPEPSSASFVTCYLLNVENLAGRNFWTVEEWSDSQTEIDFSTPLHPEAFEALIAGPWGKVYRLKIYGLEAWPQQPIELKFEGKVIAELEDVNLQAEPQVWSQLRNGTVAGRTWFKRDAKLLPLVNITALGEEIPFQEAAQSPQEAGQS